MAFRPVHYRRYVDDCFIIFRDETHIDHFLTYLNSQHTKIRFTKEIENNVCLSFLDLNVVRRNNRLQMSVFRKPTFTGLGLSFFSFIPQTVKRAIVYSAVTRAFRLCSNYKLIDIELNFIRDFFQKNGYPKQFIETIIRTVLDKMLNKRSMTVPTVPKLEKYFVLPYLGKGSINMQNELTEMFKKFYPYLSPKIVLRNRFTIGSLFKFKDNVPMCIRSGVVYQFRCSSCEESYIGSTYVRLYTRVCEHKGISDRTGNILTTPKQSSIRDHSHTCDTPVSFNDFTILGSEPSHSLRILESLFIHQLKPRLNGTTSAYPLSVVR